MDCGGLKNKRGLATLGMRGGPHPFWLDTPTSMRRKVFEYNGLALQGLQESLVQILQIGSSSNVYARQLDDVLRCENVEAMSECATLAQTFKLRNLRGSSQICVGHGGWF